MGKLSACFAIASLAFIGACGSDHATPDASIKIIDAMPDSPKVFEDAPPGPNYDFTCMGNSAPTTATPNITLSGTVQRASFNGSFSVDPLQNATVKACKAGTACTGQDQYGSSAMSAADGSWSIGPFATGGVPADGYVAMTEATSRSTFVYPASPLTSDLGMVPVLTLDPSVVQLLGAIPGGCTQDDTTNGMMALVVTDCAGTNIDDSSNLMITLKQNGTAVAGATVIDLGALQSSAAGTFFVCNVPEDATTEVGATYKSMALRAHNVKIVKATTTATILRPGY